MQEFNIGDRVARFRDPHGVGKVGVAGTVTEVGYSGKNIKVEYPSGDSREWFIAENFKLASPRKHAELIKQWADGAKIQVLLTGIWEDTQYPRWDNAGQYRVKPEPIPDIVLYSQAFGYNPNVDYAYITNAHPTKKSGSNLKLTYDGATGKLKHAEVI